MLCQVRLLSLYEVWLRNSEIVRPVSNIDRWSPEWSS